LSAVSIKVGVVGVGKLGSNHTRIYASDKRISEIFIYDINPARSDEVASMYGAKVCSTVEDVLEESDVVSICTPASTHSEIAMKAFEMGIDVLVEKPIASSVVDASRMVSLAKKRKCILQVGHIERFNGAFQAVASFIDNPLFVESHRLATFSNRGTDVSVVHDLMIHDLDLVLSILGNVSVDDVRASGAGVLTGSADIVNARIEFSNGCVANVTASRISRKPLRKIRFFQQSRYASVDLIEKSVEAFEKVAPPAEANSLRDNASFFFSQVKIDVDKTEPLKKEISSFLDAVIERSKPPVTGEDGLRALKLADIIIERLKKKGN